MSFHTPLFLSSSPAKTELRRRQNWIGSLLPRANAPRRPRRGAVLLRLEHLEPRWVLTQITEFPIPTPMSKPGAIIAGPDGNLWFTETGTHTVGQISTAGAITEYNILSLYPDDFPDDMTVGPDGNIWLIESDHVDLASSQVAVLSTDGSLLGEYRLPHYATGITAGPDGNLWITEGAEEQGPHGWLAVMDTSGTLVSEISVAQYPTAITVGPDNKLWFTEDPSDFGGGWIYVGSIDPYSGPPSLTEYNTRIYYFTFDITPGSDGNLWFAIRTGTEEDEIGQITLAGDVATFRPFFPEVMKAIAPGQDGNLWFTDPEYGDIDAMTTAGDPAAQVPTPTQYSGPDGITSGPDGNIWFTESGANNIGRLDSPDQPSIGKHELFQANGMPINVETQPIRSVAALDVSASNALAEGVNYSYSESNRAELNTNFIDRLMTEGTSNGPGNTIVAGDVKPHHLNRPLAYDLDGVLLVIGDRPELCEE